jgi:hypothetical protein
LAIGDGRVLPEVNRNAQGVARLVGNATVIQEMDSVDSGGGAPYIEDAISEIEDALTNPASPKRSDVSTLLVWDQGDYSGRPSGRVAGQKFRFPANEGNTTDFNNFSAGIFGQMQVNDGDGVAGETLTITFGMFSDDHSLIRIVGEDFASAAQGEGGNATLLEIEGDMSLAFDLPTGNSNALGVIQLTEGVTYDFQGYMHENGGGANWELWAALGDQSGINLGDERAFLAAFTPVSNQALSIFVPGNKGFALVGEPTTITGDYNANGVLDAGDLDLQANAMVAGTHPAAFDLTGDGLVNFADREQWVNVLKNTYIGDANLDGVFNSTDFVAVFIAGKYETGQNSGWAEGDWNGDKLFNSSDFVAAFIGGGYELGPRAGVSAVPEPSSVVLALLGMLSLAGIARRR